MKFCSREFCIPHLLQWHTPWEGLGTAKLFVGVAVNGITVNNKGGTTCINTKQLLKSSSLVIKLIQSLPQNPWTQSLIPLSHFYILPFLFCVILRCAIATSLLIFLSFNVLVCLMFSVTCEVNTVSSTTITGAL